MSYVPRVFDDLRLAVRGLLRGGAAGPLAVLVLALGIGATTALFSLVDGLLLRPLPYDHPEELVRLYETFRYPGGEGLGSVSYPNFVDWRDRQEGFAGMAAYSAGDLALQGGDRPERLASVAATPGLFDVVGVPPALGRGFRPEDGAADAAPVAVLAYRIWATRFGSDPEVLGRTVTLDGRAHTVIGVMPEGFEFPPGGRAEDVWVPLVVDPQTAANRGSHWMAVVARLAPSTKLAAAGAEMDRLATGIREAYPKIQQDRGAAIKPLREVVVGRVRPALLLLFGGTGLVLLIACANGANLLLLRAEGRRREVAVRAALGAGSRQIAAQFFAEAVVLVGSAALLGLALGRLGLIAFSELAATALPVPPRVGFDWRVFAFLAAVSALVTVALALVPALQARAARIQDSLREGGGAVGAGRRSRRFRGSLVASQVALSVVLLASTGLLLRTFLVLSGTDLGFEPEKVLTLQVSLPEASYPQDDMSSRFYEPVRQAVEALPGVERAGWISHVPLQEWGSNGNFGVEGRPTPERMEDQPFAEFRVAGPGYFEALGVPLLRGRPISPDDRDDTAPVVWINRSLAETYFPGEDPLEHRLLAFGTYGRHRRRGRRRAERPARAGAVARDLPALRRDRRRPHGAHGADRARPEVRGPRGAPGRGGRRSGPAGLRRDASVRSGLRVALPPQALALPGRPVRPARPRPDRGRPVRHGLLVGRPPGAGDRHPGRPRGPERLGAAAGGRPRRSAGRPRTGPRRPGRPRRRRAPVRPALRRARSRSGDLRRRGGDAPGDRPGGELPAGAPGAGDRPGDQPALGVSRSARVRAGSGHTARPAARLPGGRPAGR